MNTSDRVCSWRIDRELLRRLKVAAAQRGVTMNALVSSAIFALLLEWDEHLAGVDPLTEEEEALARAYLATLPKAAP